MDAPDNITELCVLGVHLKSEGYPNVRYRISDFKKASWLKITEFNVPMWKQGTRSGHSKLCYLPGAYRALHAHISVITKYLFNGHAAPVYVPYPSVFISLILGLLPRSARPKLIVLDAFISLYDTVVNDRKLLSPGNRVSILLKRLEKRAYSSADLVIVDTPQNATFLQREFNLPENKVVNVILSTDEQSYQFQPYLPNEKICRVLFIGTFIPLHGVEAILDAVSRLRDCKNIRFRLVGTGQTATAVEETAKINTTNLDWIRAWQSPEALAGMIAEADICLGIFGAGEKTQRVCPLKMYAYTACGRAVITGETEWTRHAEKSISYKPFETVSVDDGAALAQRIKQLADSPNDRRQLAHNSRRFYEEQLSNSIALSRLEALLRNT